MIVTAQFANTAYRLERIFKADTYLLIQVRNPAINIVIAHDQGSVNNGIRNFTSNIAMYPPDGLLINSAVTAPPTGVPFDIFWMGEFWYAADTDGSQFSIEIGTDTSTRQQ